MAPSSLLHLTSQCSPYFKKSSSSGLKSGSNDKDQRANLICIAWREHLSVAAGSLSMLSAIISKKVAHAHFKQNSELWRAGCFNSSRLIAQERQRKKWLNLEQIATEFILPVCNSTMSILSHTKSIPQSDYGKFRILGYMYQGLIIILKKFSFEVYADTTNLNYSSEVMKAFCLI